MKALVYEQYGTTEVLDLKEVEKPIPRSNEVLVKIHASSVNSWDWDLLTGNPKVYRLMSGLFKPKHKIIGCDIAGIVEAVGDEVKDFAVGDEVFGDISGVGFGAFAEYVCAPEKLLASKPAGMSFEDASAIPQAGVLALQGLIYNGEIEPGQKILINGAGGGVGTFALQMAKHWGAEVTCVDSGDKLDLLLFLGADHVIDYHRDDFTKQPQTYDLILEVIAKRKAGEYNRVLKPGGALAAVGGTPQRIIGIALRGALFPGKKKLGLVMHKPNRNDLMKLSEFYTSGVIKPVIDKIYPLSETATGLQRLGEGKVQGKVVISIANEDLSN